MDETEMKIVNYFQVLAIEAGVNEARLKNGRESAHLGLRSAPKVPITTWHFSQAGQRAVRRNQESERLTR